MDKDLLVHAWDQLAGGWPGQEPYAV